MNRSVPRSFAPAAAVALALASCGGGGGGGGSGGSAITSTHADTPVTSAVAACLPAVIHVGAPPRWTAPAWADSSPGFRMPYSLASGDAAAAFFFAPRLRAGHPQNPSNKVLWVVRARRAGHPLKIIARLGSDPTQVVRVSWPADSSPGEIYPSAVDLPRPGCWRLQLAWGSHRASIDVQVHPRTA
jgi:hypothetical protein